MDFLTALDIGASGLTADRTRINTISMNLANAKTTRTPQGGFSCPAGPFPFCLHRSAPTKWPRFVVS